MNSKKIFNEIDEVKEVEHYNQYSKKKLIRDIYPPSSYCRRSIIRKAFSKFPFRTRKFNTILDIGCGNGANAKYLSGHYKKYIGVDISPGMVKLAKLFNKENKEAKFYVSRIQDFNIPDCNDVDLVLFDGALHHIENPSEVFKILKEKINIGTYFIAREPQNTNFLIQLLRKLRMKIDKSYSSQQVFFSENELRSILKDAGINNFKFRYQDYLITPISQVILKPQFIFMPLAILIILMESFVDIIMIGKLRKLSWNIVIYGKF